MSRAGRAPRAGWWLAVASMAVVVLAVAGGCGDDDGDGDTTTASEPDPSGRGDPAAGVELDGRTFVSEQVEGWTLVDGTEVTIGFEAGAVVATAGCNTMRGDYAVEGATLAVEALAQTMMGCEDPLQRQDEWLAGLLGGGPALALEGDALTLTSPDATIRLRERP